MILLLSGCLTLDFMFFSGPSLDAYDLPIEAVPPELVEPVTFETADGLVLHGVWADQDDDGAETLVFFHGKSSPLETVWPRVERFWSLGYQVFTMDYRGYGMSEGSQEGAGILEEDGLAGIEHVLTRTGKDPEEVFWYALSLGGSVALHTHDEVPNRGLILESVFAGTDYMLDDTTLLDLPPSWFMAVDVDNVAAIRDASSPVLVIHGLADDFVDPMSGELLYEAAPEPKELWQPEGVGHADLPEVDPEAFDSRIPAFYDGL